MNKRIVVHFGLPKTGSSALQLFFSRQAGLLSDFDVEYPYPEPTPLLDTGGATGNIVQMLYQGGFVEKFRARGNKVSRDELRRFAPKEMINREYWSFVRQQVEKSQAQTVLLSGECVATLDEAQLAEMLEVLGSVGEVVLVGFCRDPFDFVYSAWKQLVKTNKAKRSFEHSVLKDRAGQAFPTAMNMISHLERLDCQRVLVNYDTFKDVLLGAFLEHARIDLPHGGDMALPVDNRSLTDSEAAILHRANVRFKGTSFPRTLSKIMIRRPGKRAERPFYSKELHQEILDTWYPAVKLMNSVVIGQPLSLEVRPTSDVPVRIDPDDIDALLEATRLVLSSAGRRTSALADLGRLLARLRSLMAKPSSARQVPRDFDDAAYLFHNDDVAASGVDPKAHYATTGRLEDRHFKYI